MNPGDKVIIIGKDDSCYFEVGDIGIFDWDESMIDGEPQCVVTVNGIPQMMNKSCVERHLGV